MTNLSVRLGEGSIGETVKMVALKAANMLMKPVNGIAIVIVLLISHMFVVPIAIGKFADWVYYFQLDTFYPEGLDGYAAVSDFWLNIEGIFDEIYDKLDVMFLVSFIAWVAAAIFFIVRNRKKCENRKELILRCILKGYAVTFIGMAIYIIAVMAIPVLAAYHEWIDYIIY